MKSIAYTKGTIEDGYRSLYVKAWARLAAVHIRPQIWPVGRQHRHATTVTLFNLCITYCKIMSYAQFEIELSRSVYQNVYAVLKFYVSVMFY